MTASGEFSPLKIRVRAPGTTATGTCVHSLRTVTAETLRAGAESPLPPARTREANAAERDEAHGAARTVTR
jgi:hypothetical protein